MVRYTAHFVHQEFIEQYGGSTVKELDRRVFLGTALAALPLAMRAQTAESKPKPVRVPSGGDRLEERNVIGVSSTAFKVLTDESASALFVIEHASRKKGGPPRHLHHNENEWFYVIEGEYIAEIGSERFHLKPGDSILGPREVPHGWAYVGEGAGKLLIAFAPPAKWKRSFATMRSDRTGASTSMMRHFTALTA
jgi:mannose-6-phosphate isomerase-like protein (cupin superfamily)